MSTTSVVAIPTTTGWKGRYVDRDGNPTRVGKSLHKLVNRDGRNTVVQTIVTGENCEWSEIDPNLTMLPEGSLDDDDERWSPVPGYGVVFRWTAEWRTSEDIGEDWTYVLGETGIDVHYGWSKAKVGHVRYDEHADGFDDIQAAVYASRR